jgi:hypothetical protein
MPNHCHDFLGILLDKETGIALQRAGTVETIPALLIQGKPCSPQFFVSRKRREIEVHKWSIVLEIGNSSAVLARSDK